MSIVEKTVLPVVAAPETFEDFQKDPDRFLAAIFSERSDAGPTIVRLVAATAEPIDSELFNEQIVRPLDQGLDVPLAKYSVSDDAFNPFHIEYLLGSGLEILERCVSYRTFAQDLFSRLRAQLIDLMQRKINLEQYNDRLAIFDKQLEAYGLRSKFVTDRQKAVSDLLAKIRTGAATPNERTDNDREIASLEAEQSRLALELSLVQGEHENLQRLRKNATELHEVDRKIFVALEAYQTQYGNALNYAQRIERVRAQFDADVLQAYRRLRLASVGINTIWPERATPDAFPKLAANGYLDDLLSWTRRQVYWLDQKSRVDVEFSVGYSIRYRVQGSTGAEANYDEYNKLLGGNVVAFKLDREWFFNAKALRLRGVKASIIMQDDGAKSNPNANTKFQISIRPPEQIAKASDGDRKYALRPVVLGAAGLASNKEEESGFHGVEVFNADPLAGEWQISLLRRSGIADLQDRQGDQPIVQDVVLEFHVAGEL